MNKNAKVLTLILAVLIIISLAMAGGAYYFLQKERARSAELEKSLEEAKTRLQVAEVKLEDSRKTISTLGVKLQDANAQIITLTTDLEAEKSAKQEMLAKLEQFKKDLEEQKTSKSDLEKKYAQAQDDLKKIQAQLNQLESKRAELEGKVKELEEKSQGVELGKIVVTPEGATPLEMPAQSAAGAQVTSSAANLEGKVLVVNKDYNFVVVNLGSKDGIGMGNVFSVYHNNTYIGDVKIEKIHESMSAAGFVSEAMKNKVSEGDKVVTKSK